MKHLSRIESVDGLRGVAALAVCVFHFTNGNKEYFAAYPMIKDIGILGEFGVQIFFVISGFILPYSLSKSHYHLSMFPAFVKKRLARLEPPYLVAIAVAIAISYLSSLTSGFRGAAFGITLRQLISHIGYLNVVTNEPWLNPVFWTLAIEFQFYLLLGLVFPVLNRVPSAEFFILLMLLLSLEYFFPSKQFLFHHLPYFFIGISVFWAKAQRLGPWLSTLAFVISVLTSFLIDGAIGCLAGALAGLAIWHIEASPIWLLNLGKISYSIYLVHVPIGMRVINLSERFSTQLAFRLLVVVIAITLSISVATLLWRYCEQPAQIWAGRIRYVNTK